MYKYEEYHISDETMIAAVVHGNKTLTESGILAELNKACASKDMEVDWAFTGGFPKSFMLRRSLTASEKRAAKAEAKKSDANSE